MLLVNDRRCCSSVMIVVREQDPFQSLALVTVILSWNEKSAATGPSSVLRGCDVVERPRHYAR